MTNAELIAHEEAEILGHIPVSQPGQTVRYGENHAIVDYVIVRKGDLHVRLRSYPDPVHHEKLHAPKVPIIWRKRA